MGAFDNALGDGSQAEHREHQIEYLEAAIKSLLTERIVLGEPGATNFIDCADKDRIRFQIGSPSEPNEFGPLEFFLQDNNCRFSLENVCQSCGLRDFLFYLYPVFRPDDSGGGAIDFYLWPVRILLTSPPGGEELPLWILKSFMDGLWENYFVPRWDQPSGFRKPLFSMKLKDTLRFKTEITILGQNKSLEFSPCETALLFYHAEPYGAKNGRLVLQVRY